jgi:hypothetical protein
MGMCIGEYHGAKIALSLPKKRMASLKKFLLDKGFSFLNLERTGTDHFALQGLLNGLPGRFIVDTGASNTCVDLDRAEGFRMQSVVSEIRAAGAGAVDMETQVSAGNLLEFGSWQQADLDVVLFDLSHVNQALTSHDEPAVDGILGADILRKAEAVIDYRKNRLFLK